MPLFFLSPPAHLHPPSLSLHLNARSPSIRFSCPFVSFCSLRASHRMYRVYSALSLSLRSAFVATVKLALRGTHLSLIPEASPWDHESAPIYPMIPSGTIFDNVLSLLRKRSMYESLDAVHYFQFRTCRISVYLLAGRTQSTCARRVTGNKTSFL